MRGNGARHRWLLSRFGNCPRDRRSITIIYNYSTNYASQARFPRITIGYDSVTRARSLVEIPPTSCKNWKCHFSVSYSVT